jgi:hypothetical protein
MPSYTKHIENILIIRKKLTICSKMLLFTKKNKYFLIFSLSGGTLKYIKSLFYFIINF